MTDTELGPLSGVTPVCQAVTFAATLLSNLSRNERLDPRDRLACQRVYEMLRRAETTLYAERKPEERP